MSTYTDLHTRVIKENVSILRKPSQEDDGLTMQRVVFANKDNVYFGTFKGPIELSDSQMFNTALIGGKLDGTDITKGNVKYDIGDITTEEIANNQLADEANISSLQIDAASISAAHDTLSTSLSTAISALDINVNRRINEVSADLSAVSADLYSLSAKATTISGNVGLMSSTFTNAIDNARISAENYTDKCISGLSGTVDSGLLALSGNLTAYTDKCISGLSGTVDSKFTSLSGALSAYADGLCAKLSNEVDASYVHKVGDSIAKLSVNGPLEVNDDFGNNTGTYAKISQSGISVVTYAGISIKSSDPIAVKTNSSMTNDADSFKGTFLHGIELSIDNGLDALKVNGKTIQRTLSELSNNLDQKKLDVATAAALSNQICADVMNSGYLKGISVDFKYEDQKIWLTAGNNHADVHSIDCSDFIKDGMLSDVVFLSTGHDGSNVAELKFIWNTDVSSKVTYVPVNDLVDIYNASGQGICLSTDQHTFYLDYDDIKSSTGLSSLCATLFGNEPLVDTAIVPSMQSQISAISVDTMGAMQFKGHFRLQNEQHFDSISAVFSYSNAIDQTLVVNGSFYNVVVEGDGIVSVDIGENSLIISTGDILIVHSHTNERLLPISSLVYSDDLSEGNVYVFRAGVARYQLANEETYRKTADKALSSWVNDNFQPKGDYLLSNDVKLEYSDRTIWLSAGDNVTSVDCTDFIKDGMLSSAELCGTTLVLNFNTDARSDPISVEMSSFVDNYDSKITYLSDCVSANTEAIANRPTYSEISSGFTDWILYDPVGEIDNSDYAISYVNGVWHFVLDGIDLTAVGPKDATYLYLQLKDGMERDAYRSHICPTFDDIPLSVSQLCNDVGYITSADINASIGNKIANALSSIDSSPLSSLNASSDLSDVIDSIVAIRDMLSKLKASFQG